MDTMNTSLMENDNNKGASLKNIYYSNPLDIKQAGKLTDFHVKTE